MSAKQKKAQTSGSSVAKSIPPKPRNSKKSSQSPGAGSSLTRCGTPDETRNDISDESDAPNTNPSQNASQGSPNGVISLPPRNRSIARAWSKIESIRSGIITFVPDSPNRRHAGRKKAKNDANPDKTSWESFRRKEEKRSRQMREEDEIHNWLLVGDDVAALQLMKQYLPGHHSTPSQLKVVPRKNVFFALQALGLALRRSMNEIIEKLENGEDEEALRLIKRRFHMPQKSFERAPQGTVQ